MQVRNKSDILHRWRRPNGTYLVWAAGQVHDIDETLARAMATDHPNKMEIVSWFPATEEYQVVDLDAVPEPSILPPSESPDFVPSTPEELLAAANITDAETQNEGAATARPRRNRSRAGGSN